MITKKVNNRRYTTGTTVYILVNNRMIVEFRIIHDEGDRCIIDRGGKTISLSKSRIFSSWNEANDYLRELVQTERKIGAAVPKVSQVLPKRQKTAYDFWH